MDFFHFATTNARQEFQPRDIYEPQRIRERNDQLVRRYLRRLGTADDPFQITQFGWGEERDR